MPIIEGAFTYFSEGVPDNGADEIQTFVVSGFHPGITFQLTFDGHATGALPWTNSKPQLIAAIQSALEALPLIGEDNVLIDANLTGGAGTITVEFRGLLGHQPIGRVFELTRSDSLLPVFSTVTQPGAASSASFGAARGALMIDVINGKLYQNRGLPGSPNWELVSLQTA